MRTPLAVAALILLALIAVPATAAGIPPSNVFLWGLPAPADDPSCAEMASATIQTTEGTILVFRIETDFVNPPCGLVPSESPFTAREYRTLGESIDPYYAARAKRKEAWLVGPLSAGRFVLIVRR